MAGTGQLGQRYVELWRDAPQPPDPFDFLIRYPEADPQDQIEILLVDQFYRWQSGCELPAECYFDRSPTLRERPDFRLQLIREEFGYRQQRGEPLKVDDFLARFGDLPDQDLRALRESLQSGDSQSSVVPAATVEMEIHPRQPAGDHAAQSRPGKGPDGADPSAPTPASIGDYRIDRVLGRGAFGTVYLAWDGALQRQVAVKVPHRHWVELPEHADRFLTEARRLAALDHPGIVPVYHVGRTDEGVCYIVSKYFQGTDLAALMERERLHEARSAKILAAVAEALHHAHRRGLVHRDVKPANIILCDSGEPCLVDFGLAIQEEGQHRHRGERTGTPAYMAPEQVRGEVHRLDGRTDIWSVGVVLYEMLTGRRPFAAPSREQLFDEIEHREPKPPRMIDDAISSELETICLKCLSKRVTDRYTTARDLAEDLQRFASRHAPLGQYEDAMVGTLLDSRWRLVRKMRETDSGQVFEALDSECGDRRVAVRMMAAKAADIALLPSVTGIDHANILHVFCTGIFEGRLYSVVQFVDGEPLDRLETLSPDRIERFVRDIGAALQHAHQRGIVHGRLRPESILLVDRDMPGERFMVIEFGTEPFRRAGATTSAPAPSPAELVYAAPEQRSGQTPTAASDVYAFAAILYELLAGEPFLSMLQDAAGSPPELFSRPESFHESQPPGLQGLAGVAQVSVAVEAVLLKCLANHPDDRPRSIADFVDEFLAAWHSRNEPGSPSCMHEDVQFTVYRPRSIQAERWYTLLAFAHTEPGDDVLPGMPDPLQEIQRQAEQVLGEGLADYREVRQDSSQPVPREADVTFEPTMPGIRFNPARRTFRWQEQVHREEFRLLAETSQAGRILRGRLSVFLGSLLIAEVPLTIRVAPVAGAGDEEGMAAATVRRYRRIYASFAPADRHIVHQFETYARVLGDEFLSRCSALRRRATLTEDLRSLIAKADVFQLFWSSQSMHCDLVRGEWEYALSLNRPDWIRPVYWETPMPSDSAAGLPPAALRQLAFQRIGGDVGPGPQEEILPESSQSGSTRQKLMRVRAPRSAGLPGDLPEETQPEPAAGVAEDGVEHRLKNEAALPNLTATLTVGGEDGRCAGDGEDDRADSSPPGAAGRWRSRGPSEQPPQHVCRRSRIGSVVLLLILGTMVFLGLWWFLNL